jgi:hypothetical protein
MTKTKKIDTIFGQEFPDDCQGFKLPVYVILESFSRWRVSKGRRSKGSRWRW